MAFQTAAHEETLNQMRHQLIIVLLRSNIRKKFLFQKSFFCFIYDRKFFVLYFDLNDTVMKFFVLYFDLNDTIMT